MRYLRLRLGGSFGVAKGASRGPRWRRRNILFPYDFSEQANLTAPSVRTMAAVLNARATVYAAIPPTRDMPPQGMRPIVGSGPDEWKRSLQPRMDALFVTELAGLNVARVVDYGDPALRIGMFVEEHDIDLVTDARPGAVRIARRIVARDARGPANFRLGDARERASAPGKRSRERGLGAINEPLGRLRADNFGIIQRSACPVISI